MVVNGRGGAVLGLSLYGLVMATVGGLLLAGSPPDPAAADLAALTADARPGAGPAGASGSATLTGSAPTLQPDATAGASGASAVRPAGTVAPAQEAVSATADQTFVPTQLRLPNGTQAKVLSVAVAPDGSLGIPENPAEVGWWNGGARAGDNLGSVVIAGHVDSREFGLGALYYLKGVKAGAVIELSNGTAQQSYRVSATREVNQQSLATDDAFFRQDLPARLVVITCGGPFDPVARRYRDNYIVLADPL